MKVGEEDRLGQGRLEKPIAPVREDENPPTERAGR